MKIIGVILLLVIAIPIGFLLAYFVRDELLKGRRLSALICGFSFLLTIVWPFFGLDEEYSRVVMLTLFFTGIVFFIMTLRAITKKVKKI